MRFDARFYLLGFVLLGSLSCSHATSPRAARTPASLAEILAVSDIHFDPLAGQDLAVVERLIQAKASDWTSIPIILCSSRRSSP